MVVLQEMSPYPAWGKERGKNKTKEKKYGKNFSTGSSSNKTIGVNAGFEDLLLHKRAKEFPTLKSSQLLFLFKKFVVNST